MKLLIYVYAILNLFFDAFLILPNLYFWSLYHRWPSMAAMVVLAALGIGGCIAAPFGAKWAIR